MEAKITSNAVSRFTRFWLNQLMFNREPICPPTPTAINNGIKKAQRIAICCAVSWPAKPANEFTKMKKLAVAAMILALSHLMR